MSEKTIFFKQILQTRDGQYSLARVISLLVAIAATAFVWKLILMGGLSVDIFIAYLAYGMGNQTLNKLLDIRAGALTGSGPYSKSADSTTTQTEK
jgi:hypothetical protein